MEAENLKIHANVIELRPAMSGQGKAEEHVISGLEGGNGQIRTEYGVNTGQIRHDMSNKLAEKLLKAIEERASANAECLGICQQIICDEAVITHLMDIISAEDVARFGIGFEAVLATGFDNGAFVNFSELMGQTTKTNSELSITFVRDQIKPVLEWLGILIKKPDNSFRWATLAELQASPYAAAKPATDSDQTATSLQRKPLAVVTAGLKTALTNPAVIVNAPFVAIRKAQQQHRIEAAKKNPYARVHEDGTIEYLSKPLEGELSEDEKRLIREAAKAEREGQLKAKIDAWKNKDAQTEWRNVQLQASQEQHALVQQFALQAAELRGRREVQREKLKGYLPILMVVGLVAFVGVARYANDGQTETADYPALQATVSSPVDETVLPPMPMEEEQPAAATPAKGKRHAK